MGRVQTKTVRSTIRNYQRRLRFESLEGRRLLATYYIDSSGGDDTNAGNSPDQAWASLAKVNNAALKGGDEVLLRRGSQWNGELRATRSGTATNPITFGAYGTGERPDVFQLYVSGNHTVVEELTVDHQHKSGDAVRVRNATGVVLRNMEIRNGLSDGIDMDDADGIVMDGLYIHHFLAGSFTNQADAHGIVATGTRGVTIRDTEVHHVSGDSFQADPARTASDITTDILIENSHFWTAPLESDFGVWKAGQRPGENAVDTKVVKDDWDNVERMRLTIRNVTAHGWLADSYINNKAAFNIKEKVDATFDGVTVYDSEIAFRLRGSRGNADVTIHNAVVYDVDKAIRAEDNLKNLKLYNSTFGHGIKTLIQFAGGDNGKGTWDLRNNAFVGSKPSVAGDSSNRVAVNSDFIDATSRDYQLATSSMLVDAGTVIAQVAKDRVGTTRPQGGHHDIGAYERTAAVTQPPAPVATDDWGITSSGVPLVINVLANDTPDSRGLLTLMVATAPARGTAVVGPDNTILYTPAANVTGTDSFTYTLRDSIGRSDTATVTVTVEATQKAIDFRNHSIGSFGGKQDQGSADVQDNGATLHVTGNAWKQIAFPYQVTADTILEFDFRSSSQAEVSAIGFDTDLELSPEYTLQLYGTQSSGFQEFRDYPNSAPQWKHYRIPVGEFYTGSFNYLFFANDHDVSKPTGEGYFANVKVYEERTLAMASWEVSRVLLGGTTAMSAPVTTSPIDVSLQQPLVQLEPAVMAELTWDPTDGATEAPLLLNGPAADDGVVVEGQTNPWADRVDEVLSSDLFLNL